MMNALPYEKTAAVLDDFKPENGWPPLQPFVQEAGKEGQIFPFHALGEILGEAASAIAQDVQAPVLVQQLLQRARTEIADSSVARDIIDLLETVLVSKFAQLSREEIQAMFLLSDIKQTRVYQEAKQEAKQEGRQEGEVRLVLRLLSKRVGIISDRSVQMVNGLTLEQLDDLGDALLDFGTIADLDNWLKSSVEE
jgi:predicted transposase YdaD